MTRSDEKFTQCPLLSGGVMPDPKGPAHSIVTELGCIREACEWWLELPLSLGADGEYRYVRGCAVRLFPIILHAALNAREER